MTGNWLFETVVGGGWNALTHTGLGSLSAVFGAAIQGEPISQAVSTVAAGTAILSSVTGVLRSGAGYHFLQNGITSSLHLSTETAVSLLTTTFSGPLANWALDLQLSDNVAWGSAGYPNAMLAGLIYGGVAMKFAYENGWFSSCAAFVNCKVSCPSTDSFKDCCVSLSSFSFFKRSDKHHRRNNADTENDIEAAAQQIRRSEREFQVKLGKPPIKMHR